MFEGIIGEVLTSVLGDYIELDKNALKINLTKGEVILTNLKLKNDALLELNLPIDIIQGSVGKLYIKMNSLKEIQVNVAIEDVIAICKPQNKFNFNEVEEKLKEIKKKEKNIEDWENLTKITDFCY